MSAYWHRVSVTDEQSRLGVCSICGPVTLRRRERRGSVEWSCLKRHREYASAPKHRLAINGRPWCSRCGFFPEHLSQLDVHHRDGDHGNNAAENLQVLCANCHRLHHADGSRNPDGGVNVREVRLALELVGGEAA